MSVRPLCCWWRCRRRAYDPATTHAGLTEQAVLASELHRVLAHRLSRPLGLFEPIVLNRADLDPTVARLLGGRLDALDPSGGYRPGADGAAPALAWVVAGAVIAETPAERGQNFFFDPSRGSGLAQAGGAFQVGHDLRMLFAEGGGLRGAATGTTFNLTGRPSPEWLVAPDNDVGLKAFYDGLETGDHRRASGAARDGAGAGAAGARRNAGRSRGRGRSGARPQRLPRRLPRPTAARACSIAARRSSATSPRPSGRPACPPPATPVDRPTVMAYITAADRQGLADRTQRRFFSDGTLPEPVVVDRLTTGGRGDA